MKRRWSLLPLGLCLFAICAISGRAWAATAVIETNHADWYSPSSFGNHPITEGYAPFPVFFEGWKSSPRDDMATWKWNFGDGSPVFEGFNAAHVYQNPGTYTATLTVTTKTGQTASATKSVTVLARNGRTFYVDSATGADTNDGLTQQTAWKTGTKALMGMTNNFYQPGDQILFKRGQTFDIEGGVIIINHYKSGWGYMFGAFGTGPKPVLQNVGTSASPLITQFGKNAAHISFVDLEFRMALTSDPAMRIGNMWEMREQSQNLLIYRCDFVHPGMFISLSGGHNTGILSGIFCIECTVQDSSFIAIWGKAVRFALVGCHLDWADNHLFYGAYFDSAIFANNIFTRPAFGRTALRLSNAVNTFDYPTQNIHVINNYFGGHIDPIVNGDPAHDGGTRYNYEMIYLAPNTQVLQSMKNVIYEKNVITNCEGAIIVGSYENLIIRNNLISSVDTYGDAFRLMLGHKYEKRPLVNIQVYDNVFWSNQKRSGNAGIVKIEPYRSAEWNGLTEHQGLSITNNKFYMQGAVDPVYYYNSTDAARVAGLNAQVTLNNNTIYTADGSKFGYVGGAWNSGGTILSLEQWRSTYGQDANSTIAPVDTRPFPGQVYSPPISTSNTISMTYDGVVDVGGSGIQEVQLWVKQNAGSWAYTGQKAAGLTGTFTYVAPGTGTYYFATAVKDNAGKMSILPTDLPTPFASTRTIVTGTAAPPPPTPDTTAPTPGTATAPAQATGSAVAIAYSGASDNVGGSGLGSVFLWVKKDAGAWSNTGLSATTPSGTFNYTLPSYGTYRFGLQASDTATPPNTSPAPTGNGDTTTVFAPVVDGLTVHLKFDDPSADGVATDSSVNSLNGSMSGTTSPAYSASGLIDGAYDFDGGDRVSLGTMDVAGSGITMAAWVKPDTYGAYRKVICKADGVAQANTYWSLVFNADGTRPRIQIKTAGDGVTDALEAPTGIPLNQWTHLAGTFDGTTMRLYINGAQVASLAKSGTLGQGPTAQAWIGDVPPGGGRGWDGMIDEVRIYIYALPANEISALSEAGGSAGPTDTTAPTAGSASVAGYSKAWPLTVSYTGAGDTDSGLKSVTLWAQKGAGAWASTGLSSAAAAGSFSYTGAGDDTYRFALVAEDNAGNKSATPSGTSGFPSAVYDATPPTTGSVSVSQYSGTPVNVTISGVSDATSGIQTVELWAKKGTGAWAATGLTTALGAATLSWGGTTGDATYYFGIRVVDKAGNATPAPSGNGQGSAILDSQAPTAGTLSAAASSTKTSPISLTFASASDGGSGLKEVALWFKKNSGGAWTDSGMKSTSASGSFSFAGTSGDATYFFALRAEDNAGNKSAAPAGSGAASVLLDSQAPAVGTVTVASQFIKSAPFAVSYSGVTDAGSGVKEVRLWSKRGTGSWTDSGLTSTAASGSFSYSPAQGDGVYAFALKVEDNVGNATANPSGSGQTSTTFDTTAPTIGALTGATSANQAPVTLSYTGAADTTSGLKNVHLWVRKPGSGWVDTGMVSTLASGSFAYNDFTTAGSYNFAVQSEDKASNSSPSPSGAGQLTVTFDSAAPDAPTSVTAPATTKVSPIPVSYSGAADAASGLKQVILWVKKGAGAWAATTVVSTANAGTLNYSGMSGDATYYFAVQSEDNAGNKSAAPTGNGQANTVFDATAPAAAAVTAPGHASAVPIAITYTSAADVTEGRLWFKKGADAWVDTGLTQSGAGGGFSFSGVTGDGSYAWAVQTKDGAGNQSAAPTGSGSATTVFDTAAPTPAAVSAPAFASASPVTVTYANAADASSGVKEVALWFKVGTGGTWTNSGLTAAAASGSFPFAGATADGAYIFATRVTDNAGNVSTIASAPTATTVYDTAAPNPGAASASAAASSSPVTVSYSGASDAGSGIAQVELWVQTDGGAWASAGLSSPSASGTFPFAPPADGSFAFALRATDKAGNLSPVPSGAGDATTVYDSTPPSGAAVSAPAFAKAAPVTLTYAGAGDVTEALLWFKKGAGAWTDSGMASNGASGSFDFNGFSGDDTYFFAVQTRDSANNLSEAPTGNGAASMVFDATAPAGGAMTAPQYHGGGDLTLSYSGVTDARSGVKLVRLFVRKDGAGWQDSGVSHANGGGNIVYAPGQGEGTYEFALQGEDNAGNVAEAPSAALASTIVDTTAPAGGALTAPEQASQGPLVLAYGGLTDNASGVKTIELWVRKGLGAWTATDQTSTADEGTFNFAGLTGDGTYYFALVAEDNAGNRGAEPAGDGLDSTVVDVSGPTAPAVTAPAYAAGAPIAVNYSGAADSGSGLKSVTLWAKKDAGAWASTGLTSASASGSFAYTGISGDGRYYFHVQAEDNAGNKSPQPAGDGAASTVVDTTAPTLGTLTASSAYDTSSPIDLVFGGIADAGSGLKTVTLWAKKDAGAWAATPSTSANGSGQFAYAATGGEGTYAFALVAEDKAGNVSATPTGSGLATVAFDTTAPAAGTMTAPAYATQSPVALTFAGVTDAGSGLEEVRLYVRKDSGAWTEANPAQTATTASGSFSYAIATGDGTYRFALRSKDKAGNESPLPSGAGLATTQFDSTAPTPGAVTAPAFSKTSPVSLTYTGANDDGSGLQKVKLWVRKDAGAWTDTGLEQTSSSGGFSYTGFSGDGVYYFALQAQNKAGLLSPTPTGTGSASTVFDTAAPSVGTLQTPAQEDNPPINILYSGVADGSGSGIAKVYLWARKDAGAWADTGQLALGASGSFSYTGMSGNGTYYFALRTEDKAGNLSPAPSGNGQAAVTYDTTFTAGTASSPAYSTQSPIVVSYTGAQTTDFGLIVVHLWVRKGAEGTWTDTGTTQNGSSGQFHYGTSGDDTYYFALQAESPGGGSFTAEPFGDGDTHTVLDTTPPAAQVLTSPPYAKEAPITIEYAAIEDEGSGVKQVLIWVKKGLSGVWEDTGMTLSGMEGSFQYSELPEDDTYYFYLQVEDKAGLKSPVPTDELVFGQP